MKHILLFQCILALFLFLYPTKEGISQRPIVREQREDGTWGPLQAPTYTGTDGRPYILNKGDPDFKTYDRWVRFHQYQAIPPHVWQHIKRDYLSTFLLNNQPVSGLNNVNLSQHRIHEQMGGDWQSEYVPSHLSYNYYESVNVKVPLHTPTNWSVNIHLPTLRKDMDFAAENGIEISEYIRPFGYDVEARRDFNRYNTQHDDPNPHLQELFSTIYTLWKDKYHDEMYTKIGMAKDYQDFLIILEKAYQMEKESSQRNIQNLNQYEDTFSAIFCTKYSDLGNGESMIEYATRMVKRKFSEYQPPAHLQNCTPEGVSMIAGLPTDESSRPSAFALGQAASIPTQTETSCATSQAHTSLTEDERFVQHLRNIEGAVGIANSPMGIQLQSQIARVFKNENMDLAALIEQCGKNILNVNRYYHHNQNEKCNNVHQYLLARKRDVNWWIEDRGLGEFLNLSR